MPALIPGFEYDIFISYRHKDNKGGQWVTEFVTALKTELEATFKEDISIYFDENPHDGLLETHDVDDSLKEKLKCLIFIPIISQTYCDPRSFAWRNEFLAFLKIAGADSIGLKVRLPNGNTASRVLPIRIHELEVRDKKLIEAELGPLRAIDFTYQSSGVNRPLRPKDDESSKGQSQNVYRDQINKTANAIKDIISGLQGKEESTSSTTAPNENQTKVYPARQVGRRKWKFQMPNLKTLFGFSLVVILILSVILIYTNTTRNANDKQIGSPIKTSITLPDSVQLTFKAGLAGLGRRALDISPDGRIIVFASLDADGTSYLNLRPLDQYSITKIPGTEGAFAPAFSPDSNWIAFFSKDKLMKISVAGGITETLAQVPNALDLVWDEDDRITWLGSQGGTLNSINSNGKEVKKLNTLNLVSRPTRLSAHEFLVGNNRNEIRLVSIIDGKDKLILKSAHNPVLRNNNLFFTKGSDLLVIGFDRDKVQTVGDPRLIEKNISVSGYGNAQFAISTNGTIAFAQGTHSQIGKLNWHYVTGEIEPLPFEAQHFQNFRLSPNGNELAITVVNEQEEIWNYNLYDLKNKIHLTNEGLCNSPLWSADGRWIYYACFQNGMSSILREQADSRSEAELILKSDTIGSLEDMNNEGLILYGVNEKTKGLWHMNLFSPKELDEKLKFISRKGVAEGLASFIKNDWVGFTTEQTGRFEVFISDLLNPEVRTQVSFESGEEPRYDSSSNTIYWRNGNKMMAASLTFGENRSIKIGHARLVFEDEDWINQMGYSYDISPDGKRFLIVRRQRNKSTNEIKVSQNFLGGF